VGPEGGGRKGITGEASGYTEGEGCGSKMSGLKLLTVSEKGVLPKVGVTNRLLRGDEGGQGQDSIQRSKDKADNP